SRQQQVLQKSQGSGGKGGKGQRSRLLSRSRSPRRDRSSRSRSSPAFREAKRPSSAGGVGARLVGQLMEFGEKAGLRFISCKELPEHMIGKDVFVLPSAVEHCRDWAAGTQVSFHLLEQKGTGKPQADQLKLLGGASSSGAGR
ncbi:unnamed protein product, partial [Polarella glacialis]